MQMEENAKRLLASLSGMEIQMEKFADKIWSIGYALEKRTAELQRIRQAVRKSTKYTEGMLGGGTDDAALENVQGNLALPAEASVKKSA